MRGGATGPAMGPAGLDLCVGTLVVHVDGWLECTEEGCRGGGLARHELRVSCRAEGLDCCAGGG